MPPPPSLRPPLTRFFGPWVRDVNLRTLRIDANAGLLGAVLALPQSIAFATLAGLPPAWGLYTAIVPCIVAALAGSNRHVMTGPTNAVSLALAAMLAPLAVAGSPDFLRLALVLTLAVGALQAGIALLRLGALAHFISPSVMLGFTTGAAVLIAWHALDGLLGVRLRGGFDPADLQPAALAVGALTLAGTLLLRRVWPGGPTLLLSLAAGTLLGVLLTREFGQSQALVGALPQAWPPWQPPPLRWSDLSQIGGMALALTIVSLGQSIAIAKALATRSGHELDVNRECLGQGLANITGSFFSCFVASGSLSRSLPNLEAGARTPLAAVFAGVLVLVLALLGGPVLAWVPMAAISALLLLVAWSLVDRALWGELLRQDRREAGIAGGTLVAMLVMPLEVAILSGVAASLVSYLYRSAQPALRVMGFESARPVDARRRLVVLDDAPAGSVGECPQLKMLRMEGSVYFGAVAHVWDHLRAQRNTPAAPRHLLVMSQSMNFIDHAGAMMWRQEHQRRLAMGGDLYFHRPRPEVMRTWQENGFLTRLGDGHVFADKTSAFAGIVPRLDGALCALCRVRLFRECAKQPGADEPGAHT